MRVSWDDSKKVRLSPAAVELLRRMCSDGASIHYESRAGTHARLVNGIAEVVQSRTVDALARAGFIPDRKLARLHMRQTSAPANFSNERRRRRGTWT